MESKALFMKEQLENNEQKEHERIINELWTLMRSIPEDDLIEANNKIVDYAETMRELYPNALDYALFHLVIGSTVDKHPFFDFPGDDSVEKFIKEELVGNK